MKLVRALGFFAGVLSGSLADSPASPDPFAAPRAQMVADIAAMARLTAIETARPAFSPRVMAALGKVERHRLVPPDQARYAYENRPLPIGHGQTISQPYIVALMTDLRSRLSRPSASERRLHSASWAIGTSPHASATATTAGRRPRRSTA
jgi:hypothetical protein